MNRQHRFTGSTSILCFFFALFIGVNTLMKPTVAAAANPFEDMFKDFDFDKFVTELEKELQKIDTEEQGGAANPFSPAASSYTAQPTSPAQAKKADSVVQEPSDISTDPNELFLKPPTKKIKQDNRDVVMPVKQALDACDTILDQLNKLIGDIDRKISSQSTFSSEFFEYYHATYGATLDSIRVSLGMIMSKKAYRLVLLTPQDAATLSGAKNENKGASLNDKMSAIRQAILAKIKDLQALNTSIDKALADEEHSEIELISRLREDAHDDDAMSTAPHKPAPLPHLKRLHFDNDSQHDAQPSETPHLSDAVDVQATPQAPLPAYLQKQPRGLPTGTDSTPFDGF